MKVRFTPVTTIAILPRDKGGELIVNPDIEQRLTEPNVRRRVTQLVDEYSSAMTPLLILPTSLHRHHIMPPRMLNRIDDESNHHLLTRSSPRLYCVLERRSFCLWIKGVREEERRFYPATTAQTVPRSTYASSYSQQ